MLFMQDEGPATAKNFVQDFKSSWFYARFQPRFQLHYSLIIVGDSVFILIYWIINPRKSSIKTLKRSRNIILAKYQIPSDSHT